MSALPEVVSRYLAAHDGGDTEAALATFTSDSHVHDDGHDYVGRDEIRKWLANASMVFTYTRVLLDATTTDPNRWLVVNRLEGNFPGGVVHLRYEFVLTDDLISELVIAP